MVLTTMGRVEAVAPEQYQVLLRRLARVRRRAKTVIFLEGLTRALLTLLALAPVFLILDNLFHLPGAARLLCLATLAAAVTGAFVWRARIAFPRWTNARVARRIERFYPELENRLINALQLGGSEQNERTVEVVMRVVEDAASFSSRMNFGAAASVKRLGRVAAALIVVAALGVLYPLLFPDYFANAAQRIIFPARDIPPLTATLLAVAPDTDQRLGRGDSLDVTADVKKGALPRKVVIELREDKREQAIEMRFDGERFIHRLPDLQRPLEFRVCANDFRSDWRRVTLLEKPRIERMSLVYHYPAYTGLEPLTIEDADGVVQGLVGTRVRLAALTNKPVAGADFLLSSGAAPPFEVGKAEKTVLDGDDRKQVPVTRVKTEITLDRNDSYRIRLRDGEGLSNDPPPAHAIIVMPDEAPRIAITAPVGEAEIEEGGRVTVLFSCSDDYGLTEAKANLRPAASDATPKAVFNASLDGSVKRHQGGFDLDLSEYKAGAELALQMTARDTNPMAAMGRGESDVVILRVISTEQRAQETKVDPQTIHQRLAVLLADQKDARGETGRLEERQAEGKLTQGRATHTMRRLERGQRLMRDEAVSIAAAIAADHVELAAIRSTLDELAADPMRRVVTVFENANKTLDTATLGPFLREAGGLQDEIIAALEELLAIAAREAGIEDEDDDEEERLQVEPDEPADEDVRKFVENLVEKLKEFAEVDRKTIEAARELAGKKPEDLTDEEKERLDEIMATRDEWAQFFRNVFSDLSRLPSVDPVDTALKEEIIEIYSEVEYRPQENRTAKTEIFVPTEAAGAELAEELTSNLESWLHDEKDRLKWNMEEPDTPIEPPLVELPDELEDLIGDLLEDEEDMTDDIEDVSSSWADSLDKGAGWDVMDGPISNFSAKGKTGNMMPNNTEMDGRSGEGRTGKSHGEFVEQQAFGKGGRKTPTRMGKESYEKGHVEDFSTDPVGGATGGGKESGYGGRGLTSPHAAPLDNTQKRLMSRQADLKMKAANLERMLVSHRLPSAQVRESITLMNRMETAIVDKRYDSLPAIHEQVVGNLRDNRKMVYSQVQANREKVRKLPPRFNQDITQGFHDEFPEGYEEMLKSYYKRLSEAMY